ncbi:hypothetical protein [Methylorubrum extorquens]
MRETGLFDPSEGKLSLETRALIERVNENLTRVRAEYLSRVQVTWDMPEGLMLEILDARLKLGENLANAWLQRIYEEGGPAPRRLLKYLHDVLDRGLARRVDPRIREILLLLDRGIPRGSLPRGPGTFHPGSLTYHGIRRLQRELEEDAYREAEEAAEVARNEEHDMLIRRLNMPAIR